jgi:hypothetical protein
MAENISDDTLRSQVRMQVAFWKAQDRRSITTGPAWLWRGAFRAPRRTTDLSPRTAAKIIARRAAGLPTEHLYNAVGPRRHRLPRQVSLGRGMAWLAAAALAAALAALSHPEHLRAAEVFSALAAVSALIGLTITAAGAWSQRDPLRLNATEQNEIAAQQREITWNPLAGTGNISSGGAHMLEALDTCTQIRDHPAWKLSAIQPLRWQIDLDEELFQIARAAAALDLYKSPPAAAAAAEPAGRSRQQLADALLERLVALHRCLHTLAELSRTAQRPPTDNDEMIRATLVAAVENELAAGQWNERTADLLAHIDGYTLLAEVKTTSR